MAVENLTERPVDLLVIGGGITGSAVAREAAARGLRTVLVERSDLAGGHLSPSNRSVYGGVQQWDQGTLRLRLSRSRGLQKFQAAAPHLVRPASFILPIYRHGKASRRQLVTGMLYRQCADLFRNVRRHRLLGKRSLLEREPLLRDRGLLGGAIYQDLLYHGARLAVTLARSAARCGALIASYAEVEALDVADGKIRGATIRDHVAGSTARVRAAAVINATGPWIDSIRGMESGSRQPSLALTRSSYVSVPRASVGHEQAVTIESPLDGRLINLIPGNDRSVIGPSVAEVEQASACGSTDEDVIYLLRSVNASYPNARLTREDILSTWGRVDARFVGHDEGSGHLDVGPHIATGPHGLITVAASSPQGYDITAAAAVEAVIEAQGTTVAGSGHQPAPKTWQPLPGGEAHDLDPFRQPGLDLGLTPATVDHLLETFGSEAAAVYNLCRESRELTEPLHPDYPAVRAEVVHCVRREFVMTVADLLARRLPVRWETSDAGRSAVEATAELMGRELGWNGDERRAAAWAYHATLQDGWLGGSAGASGLNA